MASLRYLQISDLHLNGRPRIPWLAPPPGKRERLRQDALRALERCAEIARSERVEAVLVPGDLWDDAGLEAATAQRVFEIFASLAPVPVLIAPGDSDALSPFSFYQGTYFQPKFGRKMPPNVHVFTQPVVTARTIETLPGIAFYGRCVAEGSSRGACPLAGFRVRDSDLLNILILYGRAADAPIECVPDPAREAAAVFDASDLEDAGIDYAALGHLHRFLALTDPQDQVRGAYGGIPVARGVEDGGERYVLIGEARKGGLAPASLQRIVVDPRKAITIDLPVEPPLPDAAELARCIDEAMRRARATADDIVWVRLTGIVPPGAPPAEIDPGWAEDRCFHFAFDASELRTEYPMDHVFSDESARKRVEGQFVFRIQNLKANARDDREAVVLDAALTLGLDALHGREVRPRRVY